MNPSPPVRMPTIAAAPRPPVEWRVGDVPVAYPDAVAFMEARVAAIRAGLAAEMVWLLEHPPLYTAGTSADPAELVDPHRFPVYPSGRGGRYTYHGPGQRVAYVMLDLQRRGADVRSYVRALETWVLAALARLGVHGIARSDRIGIWVRRPTGEEAKIAAFGVRIRRWVSYHGVAVNVAPDLSHFDGIVPCGLDGFAVTSLRDQGLATDMAALDAALFDAFAKAFPEETDG